jgi:GNAT superfamily N-acetyltransferase
MKWTPEMPQEQVDELQAARDKGFGEWVNETRSGSPIINEMKFNRGFAYLHPFLVCNVGQFELSIHDDRKHVHLAYIGVNEDLRQQGYGTEMMNILLSAADQYGYTVDLDITPKFRVGWRVLNAFYKKFGFAPVKGRGKDYRRREPNKPQEE